MTSAHHEAARDEVARFEAGLQALPAGWTTSPGDLAVVRDDG